MSEPSPRPQLEELEFSNPDQTTFSDHSRGGETTVTFNHYTETNACTPENSPDTDEDTGAEHETDELARIPALQISELPTGERPESPLERAYRAVEAMSPKLFPSLRSFIRPRVPRWGLVDADDVFAQTTIGIISSFFRYSPGSPAELESIAYGIAKHKLKDARRNNARRREIVESALGYSDEDSPTNHPFDVLSRYVKDKPEVDDRLRTAFFLELIYAARDAIPRKRFRDIIDVIIWDPEISKEDLAKAIGAKNANVGGVAKSRALNALKDNLRDICEDMDPNDMQIRRLKRLLASDREDKKTRLGTYTGGPVTPQEQREQFASLLQKSREMQEPRATILVPHYLGSLSIAALDIDQFMLDTSGSKVRMGLAFPHTHLVPELKKFMGNILDPRHLGRLIIDTPKNIDLIAKDNPFDYLAVPYGAFKPERSLDLLANGGFLLELSGPDNKPTQELATHATRSYKDMGTRKVKWDIGESRRYFQEYLLLTGYCLNRRLAGTLSANGEGPSNTRIAKYTNEWDAIAAQAYSWNSPPANESSQ